MKSFGCGTFLSYDLLTGRPGRIQIWNTTTVVYKGENKMVLPATIISNFHGPRRGEVTSNTIGKT